MRRDEFLDVVGFSVALMAFSVMVTGCLWSAPNPNPTDSDVDGEDVTAADAATDGSSDAIFPEPDEEGECPEDRAKVVFQGETGCALRCDSESECPTGGVCRQGFCLPADLVDAGSGS